MCKNIDLQADRIVKLFFYYFFPALIAMLSMSAYVLVDGFFVSHALGQDAVAALGIAWPVFPALVAFELLFSVGGAALISYFLGQEDPQRAREIFSSILYFVFCVGLGISLLLFFYTEEIAVFLGSNSRIKPLVVEYLQIIFLGAFLMFIHPILDLFAVNDKRPVLAMISMIIAAIGNVIFNYLFLFVFDLGIEASAFSTLLGNIVASCVLLVHFLGKRGDLFFVRYFSLRDVLCAAKNGIPACISELSFGIVMLLYIKTLMADLGERGVVIYTVSMYGGVIFFTVLLSIAQGIQPISSFNYGASEMKRVKGIYYFGLLFAVSVSCAIYALFYYFGEEFARAFLDSKRVAFEDESLIKEIAFVIRIWFVAYLALAINMVTSMFLQSIQRPWGAMLITLCYSLVLTSILLPLLRHYFGEIGIWSAYPLASVLTIGVVAGVLIYEFKKGGLYQ